MLRSAARAALAALAFVVSAPAWAQCAWFGSKDALFQITNGAVTASVPLGDAQAIAMNGQDCGVWVLGRFDLRRHDASGALVQRLALQAIDKRLDLATHLAVDAYDGSVAVEAARVGGGSRA